MPFNPTLEMAIVKAWTAGAPLTFESVMRAYAALADLPPYEPVLTVPGMFAEVPPLEPPADEV